MNSDQRRRSLTIPILAITTAILVFLLIPFIFPPHRGRDRSIGLLQGIAVAALIHHDANGHFPSVSSEPARSWRTDLLLFLEEAAINSVYDKNFAWNDPQNQNAVSARVLGYVSWHDRDGIKNRTNFFAVVGEGFVMNGQAPTRLSDIRDGPENTILFVEVVPSSVPWAEPKDLSLDEYYAYMTDSNNPRVQKGLLVVLANGKVRALRPGITKADLRALFTIDGHEPPQPDAFQEILD